MEIKDAIKVLENLKVYAELDETECAAINALIQGVNLNCTEEKFIRKDIVLKEIENLRAAEERSSSDYHKRKYGHQRDILEYLIEGRCY